MSGPNKSGIQTGSDGTAFIPASKRPDGTTRREIRVRPGYRPPEDVETYKNRNAESWKNRGSTGIPGAESTTNTLDTEVKSKNAKRREAARRKAATEADSELSSAIGRSNLSEEAAVKANLHKPEKPMAQKSVADIEDADQQKKIRNTVKKLKAVRELKQKRLEGEKLSHDQLLKMGKEPELVRDLKKLGYTGPELVDEEANDLQVLEQLETELTKG